MLFSLHSELEPINTTKKSGMPTRGKKKKILFLICIICVAKPSGKCPFHDAFVLRCQK